jgi:hypothetical protein
VQVCLLLVAETDALRAYADSVAAQMRSTGLRVEIKSGAHLTTCFALTTPNPWSPLCGKDATRGRHLQLAEASGEPSPEKHLP